jgi:hypothetical protein
VGQQPLRQNRQRARRHHDAAITNDIVGNIHGSDGSMKTTGCDAFRRINGFDSAMARHIRKMASRYVRNFRRPHLCLDRVGAAASSSIYGSRLCGVRFTEANENSAASILSMTKSILSRRNMGASRK